MALLDRHEFVCWDLVEKWWQFDALSHLQQFQERVEWVFHLREEGNLLRYREFIPYPRFDDSSGHSLLPVPFGIACFVVLVYIFNDVAIVVRGE